MALLLVELGSQTAQVLGIFGLLVVFTGLALAGSFLVVEALAVLLLPALDIPVFFFFGQLLWLLWVWLLGG